jgi:hypothetical protein
MTRPLALAALAILVAACNKPAEPAPEAAASGARSPAAQGTEKRSPSASAPGEVVWEAPAPWTKVDNPSPMRKATYRVPRAPGDAEDGELTVSQAGGSVDQNLRRWAGQLGKTIDDAKREQKKVAGLDVTIVELHGEYAGMAMPGTPPPSKKPGFALLGAIIATSPPTFFKLTGPDKTVLAARADFDRLIDSLKVK